MTTISTILQLTKKNQKSNSYQINKNVISYEDKNIIISFEIPQIINNTGLYLQTNSGLLNDIKNLKQITITAKDNKILINDIPCHNINTAIYPIITQAEITSSQVVDFTGINLNLLEIEDPDKRGDFATIVIDNSIIKSTDRFTVTEIITDFKINNLSIPADLKNLQKSKINKFILQENLLIAKIGNNSITLKCSLDFEAEYSIALWTTKTKFSNISSFNYKNLIQSIEDGKFIYSLNQRNSLQVNIDGIDILINAKNYLNFLKRLNGNYNYQIGYIDNAPKILKLTSEDGKVTIILHILHVWPK